MPHTSEFLFDQTAPEAERHVDAVDMIAAIKSNLSEKLAFRNVIVDGTFDCDDVKVSASLIFDGCRFAGEVRARRCVFERAVRFENCEFGDLHLEQSAAKRGLTITGGSANKLIAELLQVDGRFDLSGLACLSIGCENIRITGDVVACKAKITRTLSFESASVGGKLDLREIAFTFANNEPKAVLRLKYGQFGRVFLDRAKLDDINAQRVVVQKSVYIRWATELRGDIDFTGAQIGGRLVLRDSIIAGKLDISGLRARNIEIFGASVTSELLGTGAALDAFILRKASVAKVRLNRANVAEVTVQGSHLETIDLSDTVINGSVILSDSSDPSTIGEVVGSNVRASGAFMLPALRVDTVNLFGLHCETLWLKHAVIAKRFRLRNGNVESLTSLAYASCPWIRVEMSRLHGGLNGHEAIVAELEILSTEIAAQSTFDGAEIRSFGLKDSNVESLIFAQCWLDRVWLNDVRATVVSFAQITKPSLCEQCQGDIRQARPRFPGQGSPYERFADLTVESCALSRLDLSETLLPRSLTIAASSLDALDLDTVQAFSEPAPWDRKKFPGPYDDVAIDLNGTTYRTIMCDVRSLLDTWGERERASRNRQLDPRSLPIPFGLVANDHPDTDRRYVLEAAHQRAKARRERFGDALRPSLAVLESALRNGGYDDWADKVYIRFRRLATRGEPWYSPRLIRNVLSRELTGYGLGVLRSGIVLSIPVLFSLLIVTSLPGVTMLKPLVPISATQISVSAPPTKPSFGENLDLVLRSYVPGGGESATVSFATCSASTFFCWDDLGAGLRALGWLFFTIFVATLSGILRYSGRGRGA